MFFFVQETVTTEGTNMQAQYSYYRRISLTSHIAFTCGARKLVMANLGHIVVGGTDG